MNLFKKPVPNPKYPGRDSKGRFLKGFTANPTGRPKKGDSLAEMMRAALDEKAGSDEFYTKRDAILEMLVDKALSGDLKAANMVLNRGYGKEIDRIEVSTDKTIELTWTDSVEDKTDESEYNSTESTP